MSEEINDLAALIRNEWIKERRYCELRLLGACSDWGNHIMPTWDGGIDSSGRHHKNIWIKIADLCLKQKLEPITLIKAVFYSKNYIPYPNEACGQSALQAYKRYTCSSTKLVLQNDITRELSSQLTSVAAEANRLMRYQTDLSEENALKFALYSKAYSISPLFRFCIAYKQGWNDIAETEKELAKFQFLQHSELYEKFWKELLPDYFLEEVKKNAGTK